MIIFNEEKKKKIEHIELNPEQIDVLMEIGNIGSGNAITALSELLNKRIEVSLTYINIIPFWKIPNLLGDPSSKVFGINSNIVNYKNLSILQFFTKESVLSLVHILNEDPSNILQDITNIQDLDENSLSIIKETGNILAGHYLSALANLMSITLIPDVPYVAFDIMGAIANCIIARFSQAADYTIVIDTKIQIEDINMDGVFCFIPDFNILRKFFNSLEIECLF